MAISCLGFNTMTLFSRRIFKINDVPVNASLIFWFYFVGMICPVPRNSPMGDNQNIWLTGEHSEPIGTIRTLAYGPTQKSPLAVQAVFQVAPAPISSRFLCPRPPLLFSAPNQNRHATQAIDSQTSRRFAWALAQLSALQKLRTYDHSTLFGTTDLKEDLKNIFRGITMGIGPIWGIHSLSFILSCRNGI